MTQIHNFVSDRRKAIRSKNLTELCNFFRKYDLTIPNNETVIYMSIVKTIPHLTDLSDIEKVELIDYYTNQTEGGYTCKRCTNTEFSDFANYCRICGLKIERE